ncbi:MAG TPA: MaoC family dehydratase [Anaerolineaceae bacterium]
MKNELNRTITIGTRESFSKTITESDVSTFVGLVGDFNPQHVDVEYARRSRLGKRTIPVSLIGGLIASAINTRLPGIGCTWLSQHIEFLSPVFIGDTLTVEVEVVSWEPDRRLMILKTDCYNQERRQVVTGQATLNVPEVQAP